MVYSFLYKQTCTIKHFIFYIPSSTTIFGFILIIISSQTCNGDFLNLLLDGPCGFAVPFGVNVVPSLTQQIAISSVIIANSLSMGCPRSSSSIFGCSFEWSTISRTSLPLLSASSSLTGVTLFDRRRKAFRKRSFSDNFCLFDPFFFDFVFWFFASEKECIYITSKCY